MYFENPLNAYTPLDTLAEKNRYDPPFVVCTVAGFLLVKQTPLLTTINELAHLNDS